MAYLKPAFFVKHVFNPLAMRFGGYGTETLAVPRRSTGGTQTIPVIPFDQNGARYVVSVRGEAEWVRNTRAAASVELRTTKGTSQTYCATEVPVAERPPLIEAYRKKAGKTVTAYWKKLPDPADHPVFRLEPAA